MKVIIVNPMGDRFDISGIINDNIQLSSNLDNFPLELNFELAYNYREHLPFSPIDLEKGACAIELYDDQDNNIFQGIIPKVSINKKNPKFTAFDPCFYILRIADIFQFNNISANECIKLMLEQFNMPVGIIENCEVKIDEYYYKETIGEIIKKIIEIIKEESGENWYFYFKDNAFNFCKKNSDKYLQGNLEINDYFIKIQNEYINIFEFMKDTNYSVSFENMKNSVIVVDGDEKKMNKIDTARDEENIKKYGLLQLVVKQEKNNQNFSSKNNKNDKNNTSKQKNKKTKALNKKRKIYKTSSKRPTSKKSDVKKIKKLIKAVNLLDEKNKLEKNYSLAVPGIPTLRAGDLVEIFENPTGIEGIFEIKSINHNFSRKYTLFGTVIYFMSLTLNFLTEGEKNEK